MSGIGRIRETRARSSTAIRRLMPKINVSKRAKSCLSNKKNQESREENKIKGLKNKVKSSSKETVISNDSDDELDNNPFNKKITDLIRDSKNGKFDKVKFTVNGKAKNYSPIYNWFESEKTLEKLSDKETKDQKMKKLNFKCILCEFECCDKLGRYEDLITHLEMHPQTKNWLDEFEKSKKDEKDHLLKLDSKANSLVKFFVTSNHALDALDNKFLRGILPIKTTKNSFIDVIVPNVTDKIHMKINEKLKSSVLIHLAAHIVKHYDKSKFLILVASLVKSNNQTELLVIGVEEFRDKYSNKSLKSAIEKILNNYEFTFSKIVSVTCDEGSIFLNDFRDPSHIPFLEYEFSKENKIEEELETLTKQNSKFLDDELVVDPEKLNSSENVNIFSNNPVQDCQVIGEALEFSNFKTARYFCASHKINQAVSESINFSPHIGSLIDSIVEFSSKNPELFVREKLNQKFSSWIVLFEILLRVYKLKISNPNIDVNAAENDLETYLHILLPVYLLERDLAAKEANVSCLISSLFFVIYENLCKMRLPHENHVHFRNSLASKLIKKFDREITSSVYQVSAILNVEKLDSWKSKPYGEKYYQDGINSLTNIFELFDTKNLKTYVREKKSVFVLSGLDLLGNTLQNEDATEKKNAKYTKEIDRFKQLIANHAYIGASTTDFWNKYKQNLPNLYNLMTRTSSIPVTSSFIEHNFKIFDNFRNKNLQDLSNELLSHRGFIKANFNLI